MNQITFGTHPLKEDWKKIQVHPVGATLVHIEIPGIKCQENASWTQELQLLTGGIS